jgi:hypothetical protein
LRRNAKLWIIGLLEILSVLLLDATYFDDIAVHTRLDGIDEIKKHLGSLEGHIPAHNYEIVDPKVQLFDEVAILTIRYHGSTTDGQSGGAWKATSVYHLKNDDGGKWFMLIGRL